MQNNPSPSMFSIVIPTYNRAEYLKFTLDTCLKQTYPHVEFVIQDDNSTDDTASVARSYVERDGRFKYINVGKNVGMRRNFESSLHNISGNYVIFLGGDDALIPNGLNDLAELIGRFPSKVITWAVPNYHYDAVSDGEGRIVASHAIFTSAIEMELFSRDYFEDQSQRLFYVNDDKSPMIYVKSAVPRKLIDKVVRQTKGVFFASSTPDGYSGFALASIVDTYIFTNRPFSMHGISPSSQGLNYVSGSNDKNDHSAKFFQESKAVPMAPQLASEQYSPLISLMTADFIFQTDNIFGHGFGRLVDFENLIDKSLQELSSGSFSDEKITRELSIIFNVAKSGNKPDYFLRSLNGLRRKLRPPLHGDMISPNVLIISAPRRNIRNVSEAADYIYEIRNSKMIYLRMRLLQLIIGSIRYKLESRRMGENLSKLFRGDASVTSEPGSN